MVTELPTCEVCGKPTEFSLDGKISVCMNCILDTVVSGGELFLPRKKKSVDSRKKDMAS